MSFLELFAGIFDFKGDLMQSVDGEELESIELEYSLSLWLYIRKQLPGRQVTVMSKTKEGSSQPLISLQERSLLIKFATERTSSETLFSSTDLPLRKWVHILFTISSSEVTEASLYINGALDSQLSVCDKMVLNPGKLYIGKDPWTHGFTGQVADPLLFFTALSQGDASYIHNYSKSCWETQGSFNTAAALPAKHEISFSGLPKPSAEPKAAQIETKHSQQSISVVETPAEKLARYFNEYPKTYPQVVLMIENFDWLFVAFRILRISLPTFKDEANMLVNFLEVDRMLPALRDIQVKLKKRQLVELAIIVKAYKKVEYVKIPSWCDLQKDDVINFEIFLDSLKSFVESPGQSYQMEDIPLEEKFEQLYAIAEDFVGYKNVPFDLGIDFCVNCEAHQTSTWHDSAEYVSWYNQVHHEIMQEFTGAEITGNKFGPPQIGVFAVYMEGIGPTRYHDKYNRYCIYRAINKKPIPRLIIDAIYLIAYELDSFTNISNKQTEYKTEVPQLPKHPDSVSGTMSVEGSPKREKLQVEISPGEEMYCKNWGCPVKVYVHSSNNPRACTYHPGKWEFGSVHSLWPEHWTCCRGDWASEGCKVGPHKGVPNSYVPKICINRGQVRPKTFQADSFCGSTFFDPSTCERGFEQESCKYHSGYLIPKKQGGGIWSCCKQESDGKVVDNTFCVEEKHRFAEFPNEEAKLYFISKPSVHPRAKTPIFRELAKNCRYFNTEIKPYADPSAYKKYLATLENEPRYCLNWACEKVYKESRNHNKACKCHVGYWDFGHTGVMKGKQPVLLWKPHWSCCGGKWDKPGCRKTAHYGPLVSEMPERKWKWPQEGAQRYMSIKISQRWQEKLHAEELSQFQVEKKFDLFTQELGSKELPASEMFKLCRELHLHLLCLNEDRTFMFKYQDAVNGDAQKKLADKRGMISKEPFVNWWFAPLSVIRPNME